LIGAGLLRFAPSVFFGLLGFLGMFLHSPSA
jgi:hypothetical protein